MEMGRVSLGASNGGDGNPEKTEYIEFSRALGFTEALSLRESIVSIVKALKNEQVMNKTKHTDDKLHLSFSRSLKSNLQVEFFTKS